MKTKCNRNKNIAKIAITKNIEQEKHVNRYFYSYYYFQNSVPNKISANDQPKIRLDLINFEDLIFFLFKNRK